jgi:hypothetical protein
MCEAADQAIHTLDFLLIEAKDTLATPQPRLRTLASIGTLCRDVNPMS